MKRIFLLIIVYCLLFTPVFAQKATDYKLLAPIPLSGVDQGDTKTTTAGPYIQGLFTLIIAIAGGLAVLKIIFGGIQYMSTDAFQGKSEAKSTIQNAIWGLLLAIGAWLILFTINEDLVKFDLSIPVQEIKTPTGGGDIILPPGPSNCLGCVTVGVPHKLPMTSATECGRPSGCGCAYPGPCKVNSTLNSRLLTLDLATNFLVTESFPPTRVHSNSCHLSGTCVD